MESESALLKVINSNIKFRGIELDDFHFDVKKSKKRADKSLNLRHTKEVRVFTVDEAAEFLRIKRTSMYELVKSGRLTSFHIGSRRLISKTALVKFIREAEEGE